MGRKIYVGIDVGGSWLKAVAVELHDWQVIQHIPKLVEKVNPVTVRSRLSENSEKKEFIDALDELLSKLLKDGDSVKGVGISSPGIVDYHGKRILAVANHLQALKNNFWIEYLQQRLQACVVLINDAEATAIGAAALGYLQGNKIIGVMPVGTGLGFSVWRNGRRWTPNYSLNLLGSIYTPDGYYDSLSSASKLSEKDESNNLSNFFIQDRYEKQRNKYVKDLSGIISAAHVLYGVNEVLIGGGLAAAMTDTAYPLAIMIMEELKREALLDSDTVEVKLMPEGNLLPLIGILLLSVGEEKAQSLRLKKQYSSYSTEKPFSTEIRLEELDSLELVRLLWKAEQDAGAKLEISLPKIASVVEETIRRLQSGGRLIYVGAGTSGRLAAIDTVEIACTFGFPRDRVLTFIAGGIADASIDIETNFEEDASSVSDLLLANINDKDIVIGISASGSAYYVQSALGFAKSIGAYSVLIQVGDDEVVPFCNTIISLQTGNEVIAGSTRMKAGTATKKVLNFISTSTMVRMGKVHGCYMTDLECVNEKLVDRAKHILNILFGLNESEASQKLREHDFNLTQTIHSLNKFS